MSDPETLVKSIENKVRQLTGLLEILESESARLKKENVNLHQIIEEQKTLIQRLEEKNMQLYLNRSLSSGKDTVHVKQRINELVREVDRCIALLNK